MAQVQIQLEVGGPDLIPRGQAWNMDLLWRLDDDVLTPTSATISLYDAVGTAILSAQSTTEPEVGRLRRAITSADTEDETLSEGWRAIWSITYGGVLYEVTRDVALCRYVPRCPVTTQDLYDLHPTLRTSLPTGLYTFQAQIRQAWVRVTEWLYSLGRRPWLIVSAGAVRDLVVAEALAIVFGDARGSNPRFESLAAEYRQAAKDLRTSLRFDYDSDEDGVGDGQRSASPVVYLSAGPRRGLYL